MAVAANGVIGRGNDLPWRLSADLRRFKELTMGHHLVMGRKTWESIGRPLPGRVMVVISRSRPQVPSGVVLVESIPQALEVARRAGDDEVFVVGGGEIYRQTLELADRLYLTRVHAEVVGDVCFPAWDEDRWKLLSRSQVAADERNDHAVSFEVYERRAEREDSAETTSD